jgi:alpha-glucosidase
MRIPRLHCSCAAPFVVLCLVTVLALPMQAKGAADDTLVAGPVTGFTNLPNGLDVRAGEAQEVILALRDDVLRIRVAHQAPLVEDGSWAVLGAAKASSVPVMPENTPEHIGFRTHSLSVEIDRKTLMLTVRDAGGAIVQQDARPVRFVDAEFRIAKVMPADEHYFGLGDKTGPLDRRGEAFLLWNTDAYRFQESTDPLYKSIPFFMTYRGGLAAGILLDNTWRSSFDFGRESPQVYSFGAVDGPLDYYILYGPSPKQVVESYAWLTGTPPLPPMWMLGFQQSRYSYFPQSRVLEIARHLRDDRIPADAIYLDIDFQQNNRPFTVNKELFPDFSGMIAQLRAENFHVVAITDLHIADLPGRHYLPYESGIAGDHFVKNPDRSVYSGMVWPGPSVFPDFTRQQTREWWGKLPCDFAQAGIEGFWNDMNEPSVFSTQSHTIPENVIHRIDEPGFRTRTATHAEIHNVYGMENARATFEGLRNLQPDIRPFVLTRATYAGGQRYAATWTGDNSSTWNHLRMTTPMLESLGLSGFAFTGADVGGFAGTPPIDLLTKWLEVAAFQPIDRDHTEKGTGDQEPWVGGPEQEAIRRRFIEERYRLMPYLYTLAEEASRTGLPMVRPLFLEFPDAFPDRHPIDIDAQASSEFLLGPDLLIAPSPYPEELDTYVVEFPSVRWYDYWTGQELPAPPRSTDPSPAVISVAQAPLYLPVHPRLGTLPVFVRAGSIVPIAPLVQSTNETPTGPLTLRVFAGDNCAGNIYLDDGKTLAYQRGDYLRIRFSCRVEQDKLLLQVSSREGSYAPWWKEIHVDLYGWTPKQNRVLVNGKPESISLDHSAHGVSFTVADDGKGQVLELR